MGRIKKILSFIDRYQGLILLLASPFIIFSSPARTPAMLVVPGLWLLAWIARGKVLPESRFRGAMLLLAVMVLVSLWATYDIAISLPKVSGMVLGMGVFYEFSRFSRSPAGWWRRVDFFSLAGLGAAAAGLLGTRWFLGKFGVFDAVTRRRPVQPALAVIQEGIHPNELAGTLLWTLPVLAGILAWLWSLACQSQGRVRARAWAGVLGVALLAAFEGLVFLLAQSRGAYLSAALAGLLVVALILPVKIRWKLAVGVATVLGLVAAFKINPHLIDSTFANSTLSDSPVFSLESLQSRMEIWSRAVYAIRDFPITGMGMNTFRYAVHVLYPLINISPTFDLGHAHNEYLQAALDLGLPGLVGFVALYGLACTGLYRLWQKSSWRARTGEPANRWIILGLTAGLMAHALYGLTDAVSLGAKPGILFWMLLGLVDGLVWMPEHLPID